MNKKKNNITTVPRPEMLIPPPCRPIDVGVLGAPVHHVGAFVVQNVSAQVVVFQKGLEPISTAG